MKREFLKGLGIEGLDDAAIDKIMAEHGKTVTENKNSSEEAIRQLKEQLETKAEVTPEELKTLQDSLEDAQEKLKGYEGVDLEALKADLEASKGKITELETTHSSKVAELEADALLRESIAKVSFSSDYARMGVYNDLKSKVKYEAGEEGKPGVLEGYEEALAEIRENQPTAFYKEVETPAAPPRSEGKQHNQGGTSTHKKDVPVLI